MRHPIGPRPGDQQARSCGRPIVPPRQPPRSTAPVVGVPSSAVARGCGTWGLIAIGLPLERRVRVATGWGKNPEGCARHFKGRRPFTPRYGPAAPANEEGVGHPSCSLATPLPASKAKSPPNGA